MRKNSSRSKPHPDYPLTPRGDGRYQKKIRGVVHYFNGTAEQALAEWLRVNDDLLAGRRPREHGIGPTIADLGNRFLTAKQQSVDAGELKRLSWANYKKTCDRIVATFGKMTLVNDLQSEDFERLRAAIAKTFGPIALGNEISQVRSVFKFAYDAGLIREPMRYGPMFKRPTKKVLRLHRAKRGERMFDPAQVRALLDAADVNMRAMILLALNCGYGNHDVGTLPLAALDLDRGWIRYAHPKTGIDRRCPLWPETVAALKDAIAKRRRPIVPAAVPLVFVTNRGAPWGKETVANPVSAEFRKLIRRVKIYKPGLGFYTLRHVFRTVADESRDQPACNSIMGHSDPSMAAVYRERIGDERLARVAQHVHDWLFGTSAKSNQPTERLRIVG